MIADDLLNQWAIAQAKLPAAAAIESAADAPWIYPPPGYAAFDYQGAIALPAIGAGDAVVVAFAASPGWRGVIKRLSWNVIGPGFVQGSGDIIARILVAGMAVKGYDSITTELGSTVTPRSSDGILVDENQLVQLVVSNVNFAAGGVQIIASLAGYYWSK